jgi:two-component system response regulator RegX3
MTGATVLLVDDHADLLKPLQRKFESEGFHAVTASDGAEALEVFDRAQPDVVVLDVMMPEVDGITVCKRIREISAVPVIFLSAKGEEGDVVEGLNLGADDYVTKPFRVNELVSRVRAALRRPVIGGQSESADEKILKAGPLRMYQRSRQVTVAGRPITLSPTEYRLLEVLMREPGRVYSREDLMNEVWDYMGYDECLVNTYVKRVREKIEPDPGAPEILVTVRGFGYRIAV